MVFIKIKSDIIKDIQKDVTLLHQKIENLIKKSSCVGIDSTVFSEIMIVGDLVQDLKSDVDFIEVK